LKLYNSNFNKKNVLRGTGVKVSVVDSVIVPPVVGVIKPEEEKKEDIAKSALYKEI